MEKNNFVKELFFGTRQSPKTPSGTSECLEVKPLRHQDRVVQPDVVRAHIINSKQRPLEPT